MIFGTIIIALFVGSDGFNPIKGPKRTILESKIYCFLLLLLGLMPLLLTDSGLPNAWAVLATGITIWYTISVWKIDPEEELDSNGRMPLAFASFMRSLGYLAWMFIAFVFIVAVPNSQVWYWTVGFGLCIPLVNRMIIGWKNSVKDKRKVLNAE